MTNTKKIIKVGADLCLSLCVWLLYPLVFTFIYRQNIWNIYDSYHRQKSGWKKRIWNYYMEKHAASISIDAQIASPLILPHGVSGIFITQSATIGNNVVIFQQVTIGANTLKDSNSYGAPTIGNNVYIGAGAKIIGNAAISNNARIGANAVIVKDVPQNSVVVCAAQRLFIKNEPLNNKFFPYIEKEDITSER